jgi:hypothetical protein
MWTFLLGILTILILLVVAGVALWNALKGAYQKYQDGKADGVWTDTEKIGLADAVLTTIDETRNVYAFILKLIQLFKDRKRI